MNKKNKLTEPQKSFLIQSLACFETPTEAARAFKAEYGIEISPQRAEVYDPTKRAGVRLSKQWRELFASTRKAFLDHIETYVPEANKAVRVRLLAHAAQAFERKGNYVAMADMLERIAKEMGNVHTNRRELSGRDGRPIGIDYSEWSDEQINQRIAYLLGLTAEDEESDDGGASSDQLH